MRSQARSGREEPAEVDPVRRDYIGGALAAGIAGAALVVAIWQFAGHSSRPATALAAPGRIALTF
jgi:hypothetical protein